MNSNQVYWTARSPRHARKTSFVRPPNLVASGKQVYSPLRDRSGENSTKNGKSSIESKRKKTPLLKSDKLDRRIRVGIQDKISRRENFMKTYETQVKHMNQVMDYNSMRLHRDNLDNRFKRQLNQSQKVSAHNTVVSTARKGTSKLKQRINNLKTGPTQITVMTLPTSYKVKSSSKSPSSRGRFSNPRQYVQSPARLQALKSSIKSTRRQSQNSLKRLKSSGSVRFKHSTLKTSKSRSKSRFKKKKTIDSSQSRSRERTLKVETLQMNMNTISSGINEENPDSRNFRPTVLRQHTAGSQIVMGGAQIITDQYSQVGHPTMFDNMPTKESDDNFRLRPIQVLENTNRSFSPPDLDRIPSNQNFERYQSLKNPKESVQSKIDNLTQDVSAMRARLLKAKQELCEILNDKSQLLSSLHKIERENYRLKQNIDTGASSNTPQKSLDYKATTLKQQLELEQIGNEKLQKQINEISNWNNKTQVNICKIVEERQKMKDQIRQMQEDLNLKITEIQIVAGKNRNVIKEMELSADEQCLIQYEQNNVDAEKQRLELKIDTLAEERMKLYDHYEQQHQIISGQQTDNEADRLILHRNSQWHSKQTASRIILFNLQLSLQNTKQVCLAQLRFFSNFDKKCEVVTTKFSIILMKIGRNLKKEAITVWFDNALMPSKVHRQNHLLADQFYKRKMMAKVFTRWHNGHLFRVAQFKSKADSIDLIWKKFFTEAIIEQKRSFQIWRTCLTDIKQKQRAIKNAIQKATNAQAKWALHQWRNRSQELDQECRIHILKLEYAQKFYLCSLFTVLKEQVFFKRMDRHRLLRRSLKALSDYKKYRFEITCLNLTALKFKQANERYTVQACFDAMRRQKEVEKVKIMKEALEEEMNVALQDLSRFKANFHETRATKSKLTASTIVRNMLGKRLSFFFKTWHLETVARRNKQCRVKDLLIRIHNKLRKAGLTRWATNSKQKKLKRAKFQIEQIEEQNSQIYNETHSLREKNQTQSMAVRSAALKSNKRIVKKMQMRFIHQAFSRWKDNLQGKSHTASKNKLIVQKMRRRLLRDAFFIYKDILIRTKKYEHNELRSQSLIETFRIRSLRRHFNAICAFTNIFSQQQKKIKTMTIKIEKFVSRKFLNRWRLNIEIAKANTLEMVQAKEQEQHDYLYKTAGHLQDKAQTLTKAVKQQELKQQHIGRINLANYVMRFYSNSTLTMFRKWKGSRKFLGQQDMVVKRTVQHWKQFRFMQTRMAFIQLIHFQRRKFILNSIRHEEQTIADTEFAIVKNKEESIKLNKQLNQEIKLVGQQAALVGVKVKKVQTAVIRRNQDCIFMSRKRLIFETWRKQVRSETNFIRCITRVISQSMRYNGFLNIKERSRHVHRDRKIRLRMTQITSRFFKHFMLEVFSRWKMEMLAATLETTKTISRLKELKTQQFDNKVSRVMTQKQKTLVHYFHKKHLARLWDGFLRGVEYTQTRRIQNENSVDILRITTQRRQVQKWYLRVQTTKRIRFNVKTMRLNHRMRVQRMVFNRLLDVMHNKRRFVNLFFNFAKMMRDKDMIETFETLKSFDRSYSQVDRNRKSKATKDIYSLLRQVHLNRARRYFMRYKKRVMTISQRQSHVRAILLKVENHNLRDAFRRWMFFNHKVTLVNEVNKLGPVTEHVFEARRLICNLKSFMQSENFTQDEIKKFYKSCKRRNQDLMLKLVQRLKIPVENRIILKCFNHWVMWNKMRKVMKYYLRLGNNSVQYFKCDMRYAFDKWKKSDRLRIESLMSKPTNYSLAVNIVQSDQLHKLAKQESDNSIILKGLNKERDLLVNKFVQAQKIAHILLADSHKKAQSKAFSRWRRFMEKCRGIDGSYALHAFVQTMAMLKQKIEQLKLENQRLIDENKELSQFSLDNIDTAIQLQTLSKERDEMREIYEEQQAELDHLQEQQNRIMSSIEVVNDRLEELQQERNPERISVQQLERMTPITRANVIRQRSLSNNRQEGRDFKNHIVSIR